MEPTSPSKKIEIYSIIIIGSLGLIGALRRLLVNRDPKANTTTDTLQPIVTNTILEDTHKIPSICQETLSLLDCLMSKTSNSEERQSTTDYYQKLISEWNILQEKELIKSCTMQKEYILSLQGSYKNIIDQCTQ